jgi:hypothetical protein
VEIRLAVYIFYLGRTTERGASPLLTSTRRCLLPPISAPFIPASYRKPLLFGFAALSSFSSRFLPISHTATLLFPCHLGEYCNWRIREALPCDFVRISLLGITLGYTACHYTQYTVLPVQCARKVFECAAVFISSFGKWLAVFSIPAFLLLLAARGLRRLRIPAGGGSEGLLTSEPVSESAPIT